MRSRLLLAVALSACLAGPAWSQGAPDQNPDAPDPAAPEAGAADPTAGAGAAAPAAVAPGAGEGAIRLELNKLVPVEGACQAFFVADNQTPQALGELSVDIYLFDAEAVILRGLSFQFADLRPGRATVAPFELPEMNCGDIRRLLLNRVLACTDGAGAAVPGCADILAVSTRAEAAFDY